MLTTTELMHAVLDGEASAAQARQLDDLLAGDASARAEFIALQGLFADLRQIPQRQPPAGLAASVIAALDAQQTQLQRQHQLSPAPRVLSPTPRDTVPGTSINTWLSGLLATFLRSIDMSDQQTPSVFGNRKLWIGGAVAAAAVVVVAQFGFDGKTSDKDVLGTIAPAERYRAPQPTAGDIKVGNPAERPTLPAAPTTQSDAAQSNANQSSANQSNANQSTANQSSANQSTANQSTANQSTANQSAANKSTANQSTANQSTANQSTANQSAVNKSAANQSNANQSTVNQSTAGK